jgi:hypothetical protein
VELTQEIADELLAMEKEFVLPDAMNLHPGAKFVRELRSSDGREQFLLDFYQGTVRVSKVTSNHRYARTIILARLDLNGSPHTNPDGQVIHGTHLHLYREGYGDKWAVTLDPTQFTTPSDPVTSLHDFLRFLNVRNPPPIQGAFI